MRAYKAKKPQNEPLKTCVLTVVHVVANQNVQNNITENQMKAKPVQAEMSQAAKRIHNDLLVGKRGRASWVCKVCRYSTKRKALHYLVLGWGKLV